MAQTDGYRLRVLSYNIHGLPEIVAGDAPMKRLPRIARLAGERYDITLLQENFEYPDLIRDNLGDAPYDHYRGAGSITKAGFGQGLAQLLTWVPFRVLGVKTPNRSGLTTILFRKDGFETSPLVREPYATCEGYLFDKNDCLANKGYLGVRVSGPEGIEIDVYNTHLDARAGKATNRVVRREQLMQLAAAIRKHSQGRALVLAGDFNTGHQRPKDFALFQQFRAGLGLLDTGARRDRSWNGEVDVDYILYRSSSSTRIEPERGPAAAGEDGDFRWRKGRRRLSDHPALFSTFHVAAASSLHR